MQIHQGIPATPLFQRPVITTGTFDGVHVGHRKILERLKSASQMVDGESVVVTFDPHPRMVLFPDDPPLKLLNTLAEKARLLEVFGIDHLVVIPFTRAFSRTTSLSYIRDILVEKMGLHHLIIGYDHHFGRNREGSLTELMAYGPTYGFTVEEIPAQDVDEVRVSSTKIRAALGLGDVAMARSFLTYPYAFDGKVVEGKQLGRTLGFPTANLEPTNPLKLIPGNGVYAVEAQIHGQSVRGMMNIGFRPTVTAQPSVLPTIEVHLFDWAATLYGEILTIRLISRIRDERTFPTLESLKNQLRRDALQAQMLLR
jgi:riboflavin kinase/FMN adenylyltransferase